MIKTKLSTSIYLKITIISVRSTRMRKGKDPDPYLWLTDPDADSGGPKTYGSATLSTR
jgi:hypothetical protein